MIYTYLESLDDTTGNIIYSVKDMYPYCTHHYLGREVKLFNLIVSIN